MRVRFTSLIFAILVLCNGVATVVAAEKKVVLVAGAHMSDVRLDHTEIRQLFLGGDIIKDGVRIVAVINDSDPLLYEIFLQKIVFMSARTYERRLISRVLHKGGQRMPYVSNLSSLEYGLTTNPGWVSFMWEQSVHTLPGITVIGELWHGSIN